MSDGKYRLDVNFINPFLEGAIEVLKIQAKVSAKANPPILRGAGDPMQGDISGVIGLMSEKFNGTVIITFPEKTFCSIMSRMLGETFAELTPEIHDGAAELTNIIFGHAKKILNEKGYGIQMAIPSVVAGHNHSVQTKSSGPRVAIPFETEAGPFTIEITLSK